VPVGDVEALASALIDVPCAEADRAAGLAGRWQVERRFSMDSMVAAYRGLYDSCWRFASQCR
jgi:hypothetical protein